MIGLALHDGQEVIAEEVWRTAGHHTVEVAPALRRMLERVGTSIADLRAVAVALGPGSYTGLRIGMSLAKGLALGAVPPLPLLGIPTLDIVAAAQPHQVERLCAVAQAGRGRVNAGFFTWQGERWVAAGPPFIATLAELAARLEPPIQVSGELDPAGRAALSTPAGVLLAGPALSLRRPALLAELAAARLAAGEAEDPALLTPVYMH